MSGQVTLVVPLFNEASRWDQPYWHQMLAIESTNWIFVDDGSTDGTSDEVERLLNGYDAELLRLTSNVGKGNAVRLGLLSALERSTSGVGFIDGDGAFDPRDVQTLVEKFKSLTSSREERTDWECIWGSRVALAGHDIQRRASRHYLGRIIATLVSPGLPNVPYDTQCGFKVFRTSAELHRCLTAPFFTKWFFDVEILQRWIQLTGQPMRIWEEPLLRWRDIPGSKIKATSSARIAREISFVVGRNRRLR